MARSKLLPGYIYVICVYCTCMYTANTARPDQYNSLFHSIFSLVAEGHTLFICVYTIRILLYLSRYTLHISELELHKTYVCMSECVEMYISASGYFPPIGYRSCSQGCCWGAVFAPFCFTLVRITDDTYKENFLFCRFDPLSSRIRWPFSRTFICASSL